MPLTACQTIPDDRPVEIYSAEQIAMLHKYQFVQNDDSWLLGLDSKLLFPSDGAVLAEGQVANIGTMARELSNVGIHGADVEGHADSVGQAAYNQELSLRRADAVKVVLISGGMQAGRVTATGWGESRPIASNATEEGRRENRRVVIIVSPDDVVPY
ncbi:MAG TPA: OmpA family protein [Sphingomonadaceae bacterium]|nr:OmpA family protein [Sphingomonadaceae bacterium]